MNGLIILRKVNLKMKGDGEMNKGTYEELLKENEQLKIKLDYFKQVADQFNDKAQTGEQTLERIIFANRDWAHKIAKEGLEEMKRNNSQWEICRTTKEGEQDYVRKNY